MIVTGIAGWLLVVFTDLVWLGIAVFLIGAWLFGKWLLEPGNQFKRHLQIAAGPTADPTSRTGLALGR